MQTYKISDSDYDIMPKFTTELAKKGLIFKPSATSNDKGGLFINVDYSHTTEFELLCANKGIHITKL
ncbi:hypothetical protein [Clostridium sp.]|uniref:hypothetical protein n=1 Tax=Clostridium sp. TaxID=1506 RepID=UPI001DCBF579|nr:hypothetical protein [Clostridium sp.]MBS5985255.1 hypothetical protein [Clostridium sp.]